MTSYFNLDSGPGYYLREQAALAHYANQPGVIDHTVTCHSCGTVGRPGWAPIVELGPATIPPMPLAWSFVSTNDRRAVCTDCFGKAMDALFASMREYLKSPAGKKELATEAQL